MSIGASVPLVAGIALDNQIAIRMAVGETVELFAHMFTDNLEPLDPISGTWASEDERGNFGLCLPFEGTSTVFTPANFGNATVNFKAENGRVPITGRANIRVTRGRPTELYFIGPSRSLIQNIDGVDTINMQVGEVIEIAVQSTQVYEHVASAQTLRLDAHLNDTTWAITGGVNCVLIDPMTNDAINRGWKVYVRLTADYQGQATITASMYSGLIRDAGWPEAGDLLTRDIKVIVTDPALIPTRVRLTSNPPEVLTVGVH